MSAAPAVLASELPATPLVRLVPIGTMVARLGNAIANDRRRGRKPRFVFVGGQRGEQLRAQQRDRIHGMVVIVDRRLVGDQVVLGENQGAVDELVAKMQADAKRARDEGEACT